MRRQGAAHAVPVDGPVKAHRARASTAHAPHAVHLIGGHWKRSRLPVPDRAGLRPTPARVRETLFNWLGQDLTGWRVLDAFAGSGALGLEAASRGATEVTLIERDNTLAAALRGTCQRLLGATTPRPGLPAIEVHAGDAMTWMARSAAARFDLVLLDPPFDSGLAANALRLAAPLVVAGGCVYVESPQADVPLPGGIEPLREGRAGSVHYRLLRRAV